MISAIPKNEKAPLGWHLRGLQFRKSFSIDSENVVDLLAYRNVFAGAVAILKEVPNGIPTTHLS